MFKGIVKICFKCERTLPMRMFYTHSETRDGRLGKCKQCTKEDTKQNYIKNRDKIRAYNKARNQMPTRKAYKQKNDKRLRAEQPEKTKSRRIYQRALKSGKLIRESCFYCGASKVEGHHDDYEKPLEVRWVCFKCHREKEHGQIVGSVPQPF